MLDLGDLSRQAVQIKAAAESRAKQILRRAEKDAAQIAQSANDEGFEQGRVNGYEKGLAEGRAEGRAEAVAAVTEQLEGAESLWRQAAADLDEYRQQFHREATDAVLAVALSMAKKIVHRVVEVDESVIVDQIASALANVIRPMDLTVRINPGDKVVVEEAMAQLLADFAHFEHIRLLEDTSIAPGGCVISYGQAHIDATIHTQLSRVIELMLPEGTDLAKEQERTPAGDGQPGRIGRIPRMRRLVPDADSGKCPVSGGRVSEKVGNSCTSQTLGSGLWTANEAAG